MANDHRAELQNADACILEYMRAHENASGHNRSRPSNAALARHFGISERHVYRLRKKMCTNRIEADGAEPDHKLAGHILRNLGKWDLVGTPTEQYLNDFIAELVDRLNDSVQAEEIDIDIRWARPNAIEIVQTVRNATAQRRERLARARFDDR